MGNSLSSWGGRSQVAKIINKAGLPLQINEEGEGDQNRELSRYTRAYAASGWFTGVKSTVTVPATPDLVYRSLSKDLQNVFTPMSECHDEVREETQEGAQSIFRIVRIPFKVAFVTGNLKLRLNVEQNPGTHHILFESSQEGRLITKFVAHFHIKADEGDETRSVVELDAKIDAKSLPPPPFKNMVKDVMVNKMDSCMVDLVDFHSRRAAEPLAVPETEDASSEVFFEPAASLSEGAEPPNGSAESPERQNSRPLASEGKPEQAKRQGSSPFIAAGSSQHDIWQGNLPPVVESKPDPNTGILAAIRRSFSTTLTTRRSFEARRSIEKQRQTRQQRRSIERQRIQRISSASTLHGSPVQQDKPALLPPSSSVASQASVFSGWQAGQTVPDQW